MNPASPVARGRAMTAKASARTIADYNRHKRREELIDVLKAALRAWLRADAEDLSPDRLADRLREARQLTGDAVSRGLLE